MAGVIDWLEYNNRRKEVRTFLLSVNSYGSLRKSVPSWEDMLSAIDDMWAMDIDYVDALTLQLMKRNRVDEIYSNDKDFDRVKWVKRVWQ